MKRGEGKVDRRRMREAKADEREEERQRKREREEGRRGRKAENGQCEKRGARAEETVTYEGRRRSGRRNAGRAEVQRGVGGGWGSRTGGAGESNAIGRSGVLQSKGLGRGKKRSATLRRCATVRPAASRAMQKASSSQLRDTTNANNEAETRDAGSNTWRQDAPRRAKWRMRIQSDREKG
eukprot:1898341-Pleurochrysis_carterae.AAC.1